MSTTAPSIALPDEVDSRKSSGQVQPFVKQFLASIKWILQRVNVKPARKTLRLCENLPLGEKRFVAVIQVDGERFLIGGASTSVSLLTRLSEPASFSESLQNKLKEEVAR